MFYDLNIPWPEDVFKPAAVRNDLYQDYTRQVSHFVSGEPASGDAGRLASGPKKKGKKIPPAPAPAPGIPPGAPSASPAQRPPPLTPFDPLCGLAPRQKARVESLTLDLYELGYRHVAYNHTVRSRFNPAQHQNPFYDPRTKLSNPPFPALDPRTKVSFRRQQCRDSQGTPLGLGHREISSTDASLEQFSRLTLVLDAESFGKAGHGLGSTSTNALLTYDLLAVCPTTDAAFSLACTSLSEPKPQSVDLISLDFAAAARLPFLLKRSSVSAAIHNGAVFEVCYGSLAGVEDVYAIQRHAQDSELERAASLSPEARSRARRNLIAGVKDLLRITKGRNVIFSSGVADVLGLRGPADIMNLAAIFGMEPAVAKKALSDTAHSLVKRAQTRKTWRGIVGPPRLRLLPTTSMLTVPDPREDMADIVEVARPDVSMASVREESATHNTEPTSSITGHSSTVAKRSREEASPSSAPVSNQKSKKRKKALSG